MSRNRLIDLYSDTSTRPSPGMRKAMAEAEVGDEQRREDPSTRALEEQVAALLGKAAAVFLPSGTMCNQIAVAVHCRPGDEIIGPDNCHLFTYEGAGGAAIAGAQNRTVPHVEGIFEAAAVEAAYRDTRSLHSPRTRLVTVEQTMNLGGGAVWPLAKLTAVAEVAHRLGLIMHMDGARLPNAIVASGIDGRTMSAMCDSVWLDLSKGLGCPIGGVLAGSMEFIAEAWRWKHRLGGAMRQSGIVAAAGLYALDHNWDRLADDHANCRHLAEIVGNVAGVRIVNPKVETNLLFLDVAATGRPAPDIAEALLAQGVRIGATTQTLMRAVTHLDASREDIEAAGRAFARVVAGKA